MIQIGGQYCDRYYLEENGNIYDDITKRHIEADTRHQFCLKRNDGRYSKVALKPLYLALYGKIYCIDDIEDYEGEEWRIIANTGGQMYVSSYGRIKSLCGYKSKVLKTYKAKTGYLRVDLSGCGFRKNALVHRLVAQAFLEKPEDIDYQLHHIDRNKENNSKDNLMWVKPKEHRELHRKIIDE